MWSFARFAVVFCCGWRWVLKVGGGDDVVGMSGCVKKHIEADHPKQPTTLDTITKLDAIANVLGCMFDPTPCQKKSKEQKQHKD